MVFIPTGCMALLETLHDSRPNHSIIAADFDHLPDVKVLENIESVDKMSESYITS